LLGISYELTTKMAVANHIFSCSVGQNMTYLLKIIKHYISITILVVLHIFSKLFKNWFPIKYTRPVEFNEYYYCLIVLLRPNFYSFNKQISPQPHTTPQDKTHMDFYSLIQSFCIHFPSFIQSIKH